jgi:hypothetical protein
MGARHGAGLIMTTEKRVQLTCARMSEPKAPGCCNWAGWHRLPINTQWTYALLEAREAKLFGEPCPVANMHDKPQ